MGALRKSATVAGIVPPNAVNIRRVGHAVLGFAIAERSSTRKWSMDTQRIGEIEALIRHRHGAAVDTDDGVLYAEVAFPHLIDEAARIVWAQQWVPLLTEDEVIQLARNCTRRLSASDAGAMLCVSRAEREHLEFRTVRYSGQTNADLKAERRERDRIAARTKRAAAPKRPKLKDERPWEALGISARTWRRRKAAERGGQKIVGNKFNNLTADKKVATPPKPKAPVQRRTTPVIPIITIVGGLIHHTPVQIIPVSACIPEPPARRTRAGHLNPRTQWRAAA